jgi:3-oxoacyl-[acyl-carrier protein] reductase
LSEHHASRPLSGRVALVTGASRQQGIGAAICHALAERGADVAFSHWLRYDAAFPWAGGPEEPDELAAELGSLGVRTVAIKWNLARADTVESLLEIAEARLGPLSILVNNAAYSTSDGY